jgi:UMF1 family MFS transporter
VLTGDSGWPVVVGLAMVAALCAGGATVAYNAILNDIAGPDDRDGVSSRGWAAGYLGAGVLLLGNIAYLGWAQARGMDLEAAARVCFVTAGLWWAGWTLLPFLGLSDRPQAAAERGSRGVLRDSLATLNGLVHDLSGQRETLRFLTAYVVFNAGIQVMLASGAVYATRELGHPQTVVIVALICVQFVAAPGALVLGRLADRYGAQRVVLGTLLVWALATAGAAVIPAGDVQAYLGLAAIIGLVLGGSQALARSMYSRLIPAGREAEFFGLYQTADRATSWIGTLMFGVVFQVTGDYRAAMASTAVVFVMGMLLLARVDMDKGIRDVASTTQPVSPPVS